MHCHCGGSDDLVYLENTTLTILRGLFHRRLSSREMLLSFVALGGDSLQALYFSASCKRNGISLPVSVIFQAQSINELLSRAKLRPAYSRVHQFAPFEPCVNGGFGCRHDCGLLCGRHRRRSNGLIRINYATTRRKSKTLDEANIACSERVDETKMTDMQLALITGGAKAPGTNVISFRQTYAANNVPAMKQAWRAAVESENIFHAVFTISKDSGVMRLGNQVPFRWVEVETDSEEEYKRELHEWPAESSVESKFKVVYLDPGCGAGRIGTIIWQVHHALIDGFSASLLYSKVQSALEGQALRPSAPYMKVVAQMHAYRALQADTNKRFWNDYAASLLTASSEIALPVPDHPGSMAGIQHKTISTQFPMDRIKSFAQSIGVTAAAVLFAAWALVLSQYTNSDCVAFGVVHSGRDLPIADIESTIGPLITTLPLSVTLQRSWSSEDLARSIFQTLAQLIARQSSVPHDGVDRKFSSTLAFEYSMEPSQNCVVRPIGKSSFEFVSDVPLSVSISQQDIFKITYSSKKFHESDVRLLAEYYGNGILALLDPTASVDDCLNLLMPTHCQQSLMLAGNCHLATTSSKSIRNDLVTLFESTVDSHGHCPALEKGSVNLTYRMLSKKVNHVANYIRCLIQPGSVVCVYADRSVNWIVAIYAILVAGGVYAPLDPKLSEYLRDSNYEIAAAKVFIAPSIDQKTFRPKKCNTVFSVEEVLGGGHDGTTEPPARLRRLQANPSAPAYVCFTSGSTGRPKAVLCSHEGVVAFQSELEVRLFSKPGMKIAQIMSPAFDGSIHEIFSTLSYGGTLVLTHGADTFAHLVNVDSAILTPSVAKALDPRDYPRLQNLYLVGEAVPQQVNDAWASELNLYNMYGPTEGTCGATIKLLRPGRPVSIGKPNSTTRIYVLDRYQRLLPPGIPGELYIAGVQVARGYVGRPELTAERFLSDVINDHFGESMYRTGDLGYWNSAGEMHLIGRNDRLVKLRGFRLDLDDLEVLVCKALPEALTVAIVRKGDNVAALLQPSSIDIALARLKIAEFLPHFAIPKFVKAVDTIPLTSIGKIDYKGVLDLFSEADAFANRCLSLQTATEKTLEQAWRETLRLGNDIELTADASFLALGGDSLAQVRLASMISSLFNCKLPMKTILEASTLRALARSVEEAQESTRKSTADNPIVPSLGEDGVSPIEQDWWQQYALNKGATPFNVCLAYDFSPKKVDTERLELAWNAVLARYKILRSRYSITSTRRTVRLFSEQSPQTTRLGQLDLRAECNRQFCLETDALFRVLFSNTQMTICASHILCDLTAMRVLIADVAAIYQGAPLAVVQKTYDQVSCWNKPIPTTTTEFWYRYLLDRPLPRDTRAESLRASRITYSGSSRLFQLHTSIYKQLQGFVIQRGFTFHQVALAAVAVALHVNHPLSSSTAFEIPSPELDRFPSLDIVLGSPFLNRDPEDLDVVGLMLELLPIRIRFLSESHSECANQGIADSFLRTVQSASQSAFAHGIPSDKLLALLKISRTYPEHPLFDVMVTFHDERNATPLLPLPGIESRMVWADGAKFPLMCEFTAVDEEMLLLRMEYDEAAYSNKTVERLFCLVPAALDCFLENLTFGATLQRLTEKAKSMNSGEGKYAMMDGCLEREIAFGTRLMDVARRGRDGQPKTL